MNSTMSLTSPSLTSPTPTPTPTPEEYYYDDYDIVPMTPDVQIPSAIGLTLLIILAVGGNALTILAYIIDDKLHTVYNFYILNLAITDLLLSCISMPFYAVYTLTEFTWPFGYAFCKIWLICDFTLCFESILLMLLLSLDRLLLIALGTRYSSKITMRLAGLMIGISWVVSFLVYSPAIIGWDHWVGYSTVEDMDCDVEFAYDFTYTTATAFIEFILPFVILASMNTVIYWNIRKRNRIHTSLPRPIQVAPAPTSTAAFVSSNRITTNQSESKQESGNGSRNNGNAENQAPRNADARTPKRQAPGGNGATARRDSKAARLLAILVVVFLLCWAPYTITTVIISFCDDCVNISLYEFFNWVLWIKSAVNPLLYAYNSVQYRTNFRKLLTCFRYRGASVRDASTVRTTHSNI